MSARDIAEQKRRFVGCCILCRWIGGQCLGPVFAAWQLAHHGEKSHKDADGMVGFIMRIPVDRIQSPDIPLRLPT